MRCSHTRLWRRVIASGESSGVHVFGGRRFGVRSERSRKASNHAGRSIKRILQRRDSPQRTSLLGTLQEPTHWVTGEGHWGWGRTGDRHPSLLSAYGAWHVWKARCSKSGKVSVAAQIRSSGKDSRYNQRTWEICGSRRDWRIGS